MKKAIILYLQLMLITGVALEETTVPQETVKYFLKVAITMIDNENAGVDLECPPFSAESPIFPEISGAFILGFDFGFASIPVVNYQGTELAGFEDGALLFVLTFVPSDFLSEDLIESTVFAIISAAGLSPKLNGIDVALIREIEEVFPTTMAPTQSFDSLLPNRECRRCLATTIRSRPYFGPRRRRPRRQRTPNFFFVDSETCTDQSSNCQDLFGFETQCDCAGENECPLALCVSPSPPGLTTTPASELRVLTYNVLETEQVLSPHTGQRERTCRIPRIIAEQVGSVDVIVFNEVFTGGCWFDQRASLRDLLKQHGFPYSTLTVCGVHSLNSGVFIASRWPIIDSRLLAFEVNLPSSDTGISRGVAYLRIEKTVEKTTRYYNVFGTHLHFLDEPLSNTIRLSQAQQIHTLKEDIGISVSEPVIYAGDLNTDLFNPAEEPQAVFDALNANVPGIIGPINFTFDPLNNELARDHDSNPEWLDYTLYDVSHLIPIIATMKALVLRSDQPFPICKQSDSIVYVPHFSSECRETATISDLSDHYPVLGEFIFE